MNARSVNWMFIDNCGTRIAIDSGKENYVGRRRIAGLEKHSICFVSQGGRVLKSTITKSLLVAIVAIVAPLVSQSHANAQEDDKSAGLVAVLDVAKVFKENAEFDSKMKAIKSEADTLKGQITQEQEAIKARAQQLGEYEIGSPERNKMEATLEQQQAALRTKARQAEADLLNREAGIYYETYQQMQSIVGGLASQHGISLVLRFDSEQIDPANRTEVIKGVNRAVVYHRRLDLTTMVSKAMNSLAKASSGTQNK
jgi:Skp family chaperone for outer membrane proteins